MNNKCKLLGHSPDLTIIKDMNCMYLQSTKCRVCDQCLAIYRQHRKVNAIWEECTRDFGEFIDYEPIQ